VLNDYLVAEVSIASMVVLSIELESSFNRIFYATNSLLHVELTETVVAKR
jgi:hypothetical protein